MLPTLHHGVALNNPSRLDYQSINEARNMNQLNNNMMDPSDSRINKSRLLEYGGGGGGGGGGAVSYSNEHLHMPSQQQQQQQSQQQQQQHNQYVKAPNKYDYSHLPHIRPND